MQPWAATIDHREEWVELKLLFLYALLFLLLHTLCDLNCFSKIWSYNYMQAITLVQTPICYSYILVIKQNLAFVFTEAVIVSYVAIYCEFSSKIYP